MVFTSKQDLRVHYKQVRRSLSRSERIAIDARVMETVCSLACYREARELYTYISCEYEIDTYALCRRAWQDGKTIIVPKCVPHTRKMEWYRIDSFDQLEWGSYGVMEPITEHVSAVSPYGSGTSLAIVPGLVFDMRGYRLGYGGGFYDVFLASFDGISIGLTRSMQRITKIPFLDPYDEAVDIVVYGSGYDFFTR